MNDKTQLEYIARLFHDTYEKLAPEFGYVTRDDTNIFDPESPNGRLMIATTKIVTRHILDLCQPKWIDVNDRFPDAEPHRNIEIACVSPYPDDEKSPYSIHVSTKIPVAAFEGAYAWREVVLPEPPEKSE